MSYGFTKPEVQRFCPDDQTPLVKVTDPRTGVITDDCPNCGVQVLDRGELQAIIAQVAGTPGFRQRPVQQVVHGGHHGHHRRHHDSSGGIFEGFFGSS